MTRHYTRTTHPILLAARYFILLYSMFILSSDLLRAEGIRQLAPSAEDKVMLLIGDTNYGNFATSDSPESSRLYVRMNGADETLYIGLSREYTESGNPSGTGSYSFSIRRADDGQIMHGPYSMNSFVENISTWEEAIGPAVLNGGQGYSTDGDRYSFSPGEAGLYYIEFTSADYIGLWDFTVGANGTAIPGRVYSKNWAFRTPTVTNSSPECVWDREFNGAMYSYTNDGFVTRIDFANSGFQGLSFAMAFNTQGPGNSGDIGLDRMSRANENATSNLAEHFIFLQEPDPFLYPDGECGSVNIESYFECTGPGAYCLDVSVTHAGQIEVIIDVNQNNIYDPEIDRSILYRFEEGEPLSSCIPWDGLLADGSPIDPGANVNVLVAYSQGIQHWALFDGEFLKKGFCVEPIRPVCNNSGLTNILYWDDRNIPEDAGTGQPKDGRQGCDCETLGCRTWDNFVTNLESCSSIDDNVTTGYGDKSSLNTWWFANVVNSNVANIPLISIDLQGEDELCIGTTTNLNFVFTSTAEIVNLSWEGPNGIIASGPDAPLNIEIETPGVYSISLTDAGSCTYTDTHLVTGITCPTDLALDITADNINPVVGTTVTFTITIENEGEYDASDFAVFSYWPTGLENIQLVTLGGDINTNAINWENLNLAIGESFQLVFTGEVTPAFEYVISAEILEHNQGDIDSTPNNGVDTNNNNQCADDDGDEDDGDCVELLPPACNINTTVTNLVCDPNGTFEDPSDDTFTFSLTIDGGNGSNGWAGQVDGQPYSGIYGQTINLGPYPISGGAIDLNVNDNFYSTSCISSRTVTPPSSCSDNCLINIEAEATICDNNETPLDPSDDTFSFRFRLSGANTGASWWASDGSTGDYDTWYTHAGYPISVGNRTLSFIDIADGNCSVNYTFLAPPTCSSDCALVADTGEAICDDNDTPSDPSDDTFTFTLTMSGVNNGTTWTSDDPLSNSGVYGSSQLMGPYPISAGDLSFTVADGDDESCTALVNVIAPATCSDLCVLTLEQMSPVCNDNGTVSDGSDDTYTVEVRLNGANTSESWVATDGTTGAYNEWVTMGPYQVSEGNQLIDFSDATDGACIESATFGAPPACSTTCVITADVSDSVCDDNGTPSDPSDDTFRFTLTVSGANTANGWSANDPMASIGGYNEERLMGPYPISAGDLSFTVTDGDDESCTALVNVIAPATCSDLCVLTLEQMSPVCNDNGTVSDGSDDTYTVEVRLNGANTSESWIATDGTTGAYNEWVTMGPYQISEGNQLIDFSDAADGACMESTTFVAPAACSTTCVITADVSDPVCDDNGTPSDPSDDTFRFTLTVNGTNTSNGWSADDPMATTGGYGVARLMGPYPISGGNLNITITDMDDDDCVAFVNVVAPATCSDLCVINAVLTGNDPVCDPNGTMSDSSDDTFSFELTISGLNTSGGWISTDGHSGDYNEATSFGPYLINEGTVTLVFQDEEDENCSTTFSIDPPVSCSDECLINTPLVSAVSCNDNGTSTDPSDDTYTFVVLLDGFNLGDQWEANGGSSGVYGSPATFGPYAIVDGDVELEFSDIASDDCSVSVQVEAPATCSDECAIEAFTSNYQCLDNNTPADSSDDLFTFDLRVESINNTGSGWIQPSGNAGTYGETYTQGPFPISAGAFNMTVEDVEDSSCTTSVSIEPTASCSDDCMLIVDVISIDCDDQGTAEDTSDDIFVYAISVNAINSTGGWIASDGTSGAFGETITSVGHDYSEGEIEITITDEEERCSNTFTVTPPRAGLMCPEDTDQLSYRGSVQILSGNLGVGDTTISSPPCFLASSSIPMTFGDRFMVPVDIFTPDPPSGGDNGDEEGLYTFFLFTNIDMPEELEGSGPGDGAGMLFRGDYSSYADPCCFSQNYMPAGFATGETPLSDPFVDTTGIFEEDMYLVQRFTQTLKLGQEFSLVTTTYGAGATGDYAWVITSELEDSLVVNDPEVTSEFLADQPLTQDLTHFHLEWAQGNYESLQNLGEPTVMPYCGIDSLYFDDELFYGDSCLSATIERSFVLSSAGVADTCVQELTFRKPVYQDIVLPPATATFDCGDDYTTTPEGYPSPLDTGYPLIDIGEDTLMPIINEFPVFNLAVSYKDIPNPDTTDLVVDLIREWTITDVCNGDTLYIIPQLIKVRESILPTIACPSSTHPCTCPHHDGFILFDVDPFECTATIDVPYPELRGFCDESRADEWSITTEIILQETDEVVATILEEESRSVPSLDRGDYWLHYIAEDNDGNRVEQSCAMRVADLQHPTAICQNLMTIVLDEQTSEQTIDISQIDLNSYDNCTAEPTLLLRRFYPEGITECSDQTGGVFGEWSENTTFYCCDANSTFQVELLVMDADSNSNYCVVEVNVIDETVPQLTGLEDQVISCSQLPDSFDPDDSAALSSLFGMPEAFDNCLVEIEEMAPVVSWNNCELGSIRRSFHATDHAGNSNPVAYEQNITINAENSYGIRFASDIETDCIEGLTELQIDAIGCGDFEISYTDVDVEEATAGCLQIQRTYLIINSCTYDGVSEPMTISRNVNCNTAEGEDDVWLVIRDGSAYLDADNEPNNQVPAAGTQNPACGINPSGYWSTLNNVGAWEYTQLITINDDQSPELSIDSLEPFCTLDNSCDGPVNIAFSVSETCLPERVKLSLYFDQDDDDNIDAELTNAGVLTGEWPDYRIQGDFPVGNHAFVLEAEDGCGNTVSERIPFELADCYIEQPNCVTNLQVQLSPVVPAVDLNGDGIVDEGAVIMSAALLAEVAGTDCSDDYSYSVQLAGALPVFSDDNLILTCEDRYTATREVTIRDNAYNPYAVQPDGSTGGPNYTNCMIQISVQDSFNVCASCVQNELEIEGVIRQQESLDPISGVTVQILIDDELESQEFTVEDGKYEFPDLAFSNNYEVRPYKNDDTPNGVTTLDLILLQRHLLLLGEITDPYELLAADINADGQVTTLDLIYMQSLLLGNSSTFPNNTSWRFLLADFPLTDISAEIPDAYIYYNLVNCQFGQDFLGVKIGDLNGSASSDGQLTQEENASRSTWPLYAADQELKAGESYRIPIVAADLERLSGLEISIQLTSSKIKVLEIEPGLIKMPELSTHLLSRGIVKAIWLANKAPIVDQTLFTLIVSAEENTSLSSALKLMSNAPSQAYDQNLQAYDFSLSYLEKQQEIMLLANKPDPFKSFTEVEFFLPENGSFQIELTDIAGRILQKFQEEASRGYHRLSIDGSDLPSGLLYYTLTFKGKKITRKMLKL